MSKGEVVIGCHGYMDYVVFVHHGSENWNIFAECRTFDEAVKRREHALSSGNSLVMIFKPARYQTIEVEEVAGLNV